MKGKMKSLVGGIAVLLLLVSFVFAGCNKGGGKQAEVTVSLNVTETTLFVGEGVELVATPSDPTAELTWSSTAVGIAKVEGGGTTVTVTALSPGSAIVNVKAGGTVKAQCSVKVEEKPEKLSINLPARKLVLSKTGSGATLVAHIKDDSINESSLTWASDDKAVAKVTASGIRAYVKAVSKGDCNVSVSGKAGEETVTSGCSVTVLETVEEEDDTTKTYYAYTKDGVRSDKQFVGLASAVNELVNNAAYGKGSYLTTTDDTDTRVYTFNDVAYSYFTRSGVYNGFDSNGNVTNGQSGYWDGFYLKNQLDLFSNGQTNMLQTAGILKNSWYYRMSQIVTASAGVDLNAGKMGYRDSLYTAAGAGVNYATWADDTAYGITHLEMNYDLTGSTLSPSQSEQSVYAEIYLRTIVDGAQDKTKYYGLYFDAGTAASTASLENGAVGYWYAYEGSMCYQDSEHVTWPCQSKIEPKMDTPIGYAVWDKANSRWVVEDMKVKLTQIYHFTDETTGAPNCTIDYTITAEQGETTNTVNYVYETEAAINRKNAGVRFTYGVSFTPKAPLADTVNAYGFFSNAAVPDLYNGGSWLGVKQGSCIGYEGAAASHDLSFLGSGTRQYVSIWGTDVCSYKKGAGTTTFDFRF